MTIPMLRIITMEFKVTYTVPTLSSPSIRILQEFFHFTYMIMIKTISYAKQWGFFLLLDRNSSNATPEKNKYLIC